MDNNVINLKRIPFIPKLSREFKPMKHYLCETDTSAKLISRTAFMRQLVQQPCPNGQVYIDFDDGIAYLFPFDPQRAERFIAAYGEFETEYKRFYREQQAILAEKRHRLLHLDQPLNEDGLTFGDILADTDTPESLLMEKEHFIIHRSSFNTLPDSDHEILTAYLEANCNARELARRLGKDPSGVSKLVKRAAERLKKKIEENS